MPGAHADDSLLRSTSWAAEKLFKQRGNFASVLFVAEYADGTRQRLERYCNNAPNSVSDAELLTELAQDGFCRDQRRAFWRRLSVQACDHAAPYRP